MMKAICHDHRTLIEGTLRGLSEAGCELLCHVDSGTPAFPKKTRVLINLVDEDSGRTMNVPARLTGVSRREGAWSYRIKWDGIPALLKAA